MMGSITSLGWSSSLIGDKTNIMQKTYVLFLVLLSLIFVRCDTFDPDGNGKRTSFNGKILFNDNDEPVVGEIWMTGMKDDFPADKSIVHKTYEIDANGSFNFNFEGDKDIDFFIFTIAAQGKNLLENPVKSYECISFNCNRISPGLNYDNYIIKAERN